MNTKLTSYCGLYCLDCIPSNNEFFSLVEKFESMLNKLQFNEYAKLKLRDRPKLSAYHLFVEVLNEIKRLRCPSPCRTGGGKPKCKIRLCCQKKKYIGCWECNDQYACDLLVPLKETHPNLLHHFDLIKKYGLTRWCKNRKTHYKWQRPPE